MPLPRTGRLHASRAITAVIAVALLLAALPASVAAASTPTTTTLLSYPAQIHPGQTATYDVQVSPAPPTSLDIVIQYSIDGGPWNDTTASGHPDADGHLHLVTGQSAFEPKGTRLIRAQFRGQSPDVEDGWLASESDPVSQVLSAWPTDITEFSVSSSSPNSPAFLQAQVKAGFNWFLEEEQAGDWNSVTSGSNPGSQATPFGIFKTLSSLSLGSHHFRLRVPETEYASGDVAEYTLEVGKITSTISFSGDHTVEAPGPITFAAYLGQAGYSPVPTGQLVVKDLATGDTVGTGSANGAASVEITDVAPGTYAFQTTYAGDDDHTAATSATWTVTVTPDAAHVAGVGSTPTTFYPYKDGYRDTLAIKGVRLEPMTVAIRIYTPAGKLLRLVNLPSGTGAYSYTFTGKSSSGVLYANGKYRILQSFLDADGGKASVTSYATLSSKRLVTYTSYVNRTLAQSTQHSSSSITWDFQLPTAVVYKALSLQVDAKSVLIPPGEFGAFDYRPCDGISGPGCYRTTSGIGFTRKWWSKTLFADHNRNGKHVVATVWGGGSTLVYRARVRVTYAVLK